VFCFQWLISIVIVFVAVFLLGEMISAGGVYQRSVNSMSSQTTLKKNTKNNNSKLFSQGYVT
jgi:hypothetical protein